MRYIIILLSVVLLSCTPQRTIQRLAQKHDLIRTDTITIEKEVIVPEVRIDTMFNEVTFFEMIRDTITIEKDKLVTRIIRIPSSLGVQNDSIKVETVYSADTVFITAKAPCETVVIEDQERPWNTFLWIFFIGFTVGFLFKMSFEKNTKY